MMVKPASTKLGRCSKYCTANSNSAGQSSKIWLHMSSQTDVGGSKTVEFPQGGRK